MISIESSEENEFVRNLAKKSVPEALELWIGAKRTGFGLLDFEWENGNTFLYTNWHPEEPNNVGGNENYVYLRVYSGFWNDDRGDISLHFICK
jgi:hypothetical protein